MFRQFFNTQLDRLVRPQVHLFGLTRSAFLAMGYLGLFLACLLAMSLVMFSGLSYWLMALLILTAVITFLSLNMVVKIITGWEIIVCIHHQVAVLLITALILRLLNQPILPYLAITMLGVGVFIGIGRLGCLMVGCCHGRPSAWGVCYRDEHGAAGFDPHFVGVRFFPIQAVASFLLLANVTVGALLVIIGKPGEALVWYLTAYCTGRYFLEFFRGDTNRPYFQGISEPQWNALAVILAVFLTGIGGWLPLLWWQAAVTAVVLMSTLVIVFRARLPRKNKRYYWQPRHIHEVAAMVRGVTTTRMSNTPIALDVNTTSLGVRISASEVQGEEGPIKHYALSADDGGMTVDNAAVIANLIMHLQHPAQPSELVAGNQGIFHLLVRPQLIGGK
jgi:prolipoprotein diacylglyceryltransferase